MTSRRPSSHATFVPMDTSLASRESRDSAIDVQQEKEPEKQEKPLTATYTTFPPLCQQAEKAGTFPLSQPRTESEDASDPPSPTQPVNVEIAPKGNLILLVGNEQKDNGPRKLIVSSEIVSRLSVSWAEIISRTPRKLLGKKQIRLPDDDAEMMELLMNLAHRHNSKAPDTLTFNQLLHLAVLSDRYDTNELILFPLEKWVTPHQAHILDPGYEQWLRIAYQFGYTDNYVDLAHHFLMHCRVNNRHNLLALGTNREFSGHYPPGALECIEARRLEVIQGLFQTTYELVEVMQSSNICVAVNEDDEPKITELERTSCTQVNLGALIRALSGLRYWPPISDARTIKTSIDTLGTLLANLPVRTWAPSKHDLSCSSTGLTLHRITKSENDEWSALVTRMGRVHAWCNSGLILKARIEAKLATVPYAWSPAIEKTVKRNAKQFKRAVN